MQVTRVSAAFGAKIVLEDVSFRLDPGQRLALVGRNGAGKTTLLRIIAGQRRADSGEIAPPKGARIALHDQRPPIDSGLLLDDYVGEGLAPARAAEARLAALESRMAGGDAGPETLRDYERAQGDLEAAGGYAWRAWQERVMRGLALPPDWGDRPLRSLSGGELTRASLARTLVSRPDILLLDEPTNHLDIDSVEWLEAALQEMDAGVIVSSHDRWFLQSVTTAVLEIERGRARVWPMGYVKFRQEKVAALGRQQAAADATAAEVARLEKFISRWSAGTRSRQATSRAKALARIAPPEPPSRERSLGFGFPKAERSSRMVIEAAGLDVAVADRLLVAGVDLAIERGQRVAIVGPNGAGKTTLLETLLARRAPAAGRASIGHRVDLAYFSQHGIELRDDRTILENILAASPLTEGPARTLLGNFLFPGSTVERKVEHLSGGERARLSLVGLIARGGNLLVLDEPTNHLDVESREALESALEVFDGTVVFISHDRALVDAIATHTIALEEGRAAMRLGNYTDLIAAREAPAPAPPVPPAKKRSAKNGARTNGSTPPPDRPREARPSKGQVDRLERTVARLEEQIGEVERELVRPEILAEPDRLSELGRRHSRLEAELASRMAEWERLAEAII